MAPKTLPAGSGILESELQLASDMGGIEALTVVETEAGFIVRATLKGKVAHRHMTTRREPLTPRLFKDLERLNNLLRSIYPEGAIELEIEQKYSPTPSKKNK